ncbi:MAG: retron St85 family effector protein [Thiotrichales bacterium]|nr:retron St85 family effector protein [Thiotrichales bacterium]
MLEHFENQLTFFKKSIDSKLFSLSKKRIIFVFGGPYDFVSDNETETFRNEFFKKTEHLETEQDFVFLYAEDLFKKLEFFSDQYRYVNIALIERVAGFVVDAIIIFPESVGSYCEIGYFAHSNSLKQKILVANQEKYIEKPSFLTLGIIDIIEKDSNYRGGVIPLTKGACNLERFNRALNRIRLRLTSNANKKLDFSKLNRSSSDREENNLYYRFRCIVFFEIIHFFSYITFSDAKKAFKTVMGGFEDDELEVYSALLLSLDFIRNHEEYVDVLSVSKESSFLFSQKMLDALNSTRLEINAIHKAQMTYPYKVFKGEV